jgi:hypothetical protein
MWPIAYFIIKDDNASTMEELPAPLRPANKTLLSPESNQCQRLQRPILRFEF